MIDLDTLNKEENFSVPDGYFEQFPKQMMAQIRKEKARKRNIWLSAIAASMAILICGATVFRYLQKDEPVSEPITTTQAEMDVEDEMVDYYSSELAQMDYYNY